jgi:hypothetical protein
VDEFFKEIIERASYYEQFELFRKFDQKVQTNLKAMGNKKEKPQLTV